MKAQKWHCISCSSEFIIESGKAICPFCGCTLLERVDVWLDDEEYIGD